MAEVCGDCKQSSPGDTCGLGTVPHDGLCFSVCWVKNLGNYTQKMVLNNFNKEAKSNPQELGNVRIKAASVVMESLFMNRHLFQLLQSSGKCAAVEIILQEGVYRYSSMLSPSLLCFPVWGSFG